MPGSGPPMDNAARLQASSRKSVPFVDCCGESVRDAVGATLSRSAISAAAIAATRVFSAERPSAYPPVWLLSPIPVLATMN